MYIFARTRRINPGRARSAIALAVEAGTRASEIVGFPVWVWSSVLGPESGTIGWTARMERLDDAIAADDALWANDEFASWVEENDGQFTGPPMDSIAEVLHGTPTEQPGAYVQTVRAVCANGSVGEALGIAVEIAETSTRLTDRPTLLALPVAGPFASLLWISGFDDLASMEADNTKLLASDEWLKLIDRAGHAFAPGATTSLLRRLN